MITETVDNYKPKHLKAEDTKQTQVSMLADHLILHGSITSIEAIELYGCTRLSARIWDLRHKYGMVIEATPESGKNRFGKMVNYVRYSLGGVA